MGTEAAPTVASASPRQRGPIPTLDADLILEAGLQIAARQDGTAVSVRELGAALGCDPTAIYRYFRSKDALMCALLDRLMGMALERVRTPPAKWREYLVELADHSLNIFTEYPAISIEAARLTSGGEAELATVEGILTAFRAAGLTGDDLVQHYGMFSGIGISFCVSIAHGRSTSEKKGANAPYTGLWLDRPFATSAAKNPEVTQMRDALQGLHDREILRGLTTLILDSAERIGAERINTERINTERINTERINAERISTEQSVTEHVNAEQSSARS